MDERESLARAWFAKAEFLSPFAAEYRYPDLLIKFTQEQAESSVSIARQIRQAVQEELANTRGGQGRGD